MSKLISTSLALLALTLTSACTVRPVVQLRSGNLTDDGHTLPSDERIDVVDAPGVCIIDDGNRALQKAGFTISGERTKNFVIGTRGNELADWLCQGSETAVVNVVGYHSDEDLGIMHDIVTAATNSSGQAKLTRANRMMATARRPHRFSKRG